MMTHKAWASTRPATSAEPNPIAQTLQPTRPGKTQPKAPSKPKPKRKAHKSSIAAAPSYAHRADVMAAAADIAARRNLNADWVKGTLAQARLLKAVQQAVLPPQGGARKNWAAYRSRFVEPRRIAAGVAFWQANAAALNRAQADYGVPPAIVVGILGVETLYGQQMGRTRVLDALSTLAFDFPVVHPRAAERQAFFRDELERYLVLCARSGTTPSQPLGSTAGAMGLPQFMPGSWQRYAVDFDADGRIDLWRSAADAIGSVAHYLQAFGWQPGLPTHYPVLAVPTGDALADALASDILPTWSATRLKALGVGLDAAGAAHTGPLALVELEMGADAPPVYVAGTENFYTVTRYNWSSYYALAVIELGAAVQQVLEAASTETPLDQATTTDSKAG